MAPPVNSRGPPAFAQAPPSSDPYGHDDALSDEDEPEPLRAWRHQQAESIAQRSAAAERKKAETISRAERDIDEFYREYNAKKEKSISKNKEDEAREQEIRTRALAEGTTWDRVTKLVGLENSQSKTIAPGGGTDLARYRGEYEGREGSGERLHSLTSPLCLSPAEILLSLRREGQTAPAAGGY